MAEETVNPVRLSLSNIQASYGGKQVLRGVTLAVRAGETVALCGRSGVGKSTLLRCASCLQEADDGEAHLDGEQYLAHGKPLAPAWTIRRQVTTIFQNYCLFPNLTALRNITLALETVVRMRRRDAEELARKVASSLQIQHLLHRFPNDMSGGEQQRLALGRALVLRPKVMLMDEVASAIDPETTNSMVEAIRQVREDGCKIDGGEETGGMSLVLVTHMFRFAESFADRIVFLSGGRIIEDHPAGEFRSNSRHEEVRRYLQFLT